MPSLFPRFDADMRSPAAKRRLPLSCSILAAFSGRNMESQTSSSSRSPSARMQLQSDGQSGPERGRARGEEGSQEGKGRETYAKTASALFALRRRESGLKHASDVHTTSIDADSFSLSLSSSVVQQTTADQKRNPLRFMFTSLPLFYEKINFQDKRPLERRETKHEEDARGTRDDGRQDEVCRMHLHP